MTTNVCFRGLDINTQLEREHKPEFHILEQVGADQDTGDCIDIAQGVRYDKMHVNLEGFNVRLCPSPV